MATDMDRLIGENVVTLRGEMSQKALAEAMRDRGHKWSQSTVWAVEKGDRPLKLAEAEDLARELGTFVDRLTRPPREVTLGRILQRRFIIFDDAATALRDAAVQYEKARQDLGLWISDGIAAGFEDEAGRYSHYVEQEAMAVVEPAVTEVAEEFQERVKEWVANGGLKGQGVYQDAPEVSADGEHPEA